MEEITCRVDWDAALDAVDGRRDLLRELIEIFFLEYPTLLEQIRTAIGDADAAGLRLSAHRLKGCLRYFGQNRAAEFALQLELRGRDGRWDDVAAMSAGLQAALEQMLPSLREFQP